ncbi:histidine phosphatase superfamily [Melampsora americana]|nr:histidine phosphatase superfamily [Melampsora americana]
MVTQLQRHGTRYPTHHVSIKIKTVLNKLKNVKPIDDKFEFIRNYKYHLLENSLTKFGENESFKSGQEFKKRYSNLLSLNHHEDLNQTQSNSTYTSPIFIRVSSSERVIQTSKHFLLGLNLESDHKFNESSILVISEKFGVTLDDNNCPNSPDLPFSNQWLEYFTRPIIKRLNSKAIGLNLNPIDVVSLMQLCCFESLADQIYSQFCKLFEKSDWIGYEYYIDLDKLYKHGYGNKLGAVQGVGYVAELLSRLTGDASYVRNDKTQVNHTLDQSIEAFPLNRKVYLDFSHDNQMISIISALGIKFEPLLSPHGPPLSDREWRMSSMVPFASRLTFEKVHCDDNPNDQVRILLNDEVIPLKFCKDHQFKLCDLNSFINSQNFTKSNGNGLYELCGYQPLNSN